MGRRKKGECPGLRRHVASGQGVVTLNGKDHYLGVWPGGEKGPPAAVRAEYDRTIAEWLARGRRPAADPKCRGKQAGEPCGLTVARLCVAYQEHAEEYYRRADGTQTGEADNVRYSLRPLVHLYGNRPARCLRPKRLKAVRTLMVKGYEHPRYGAQGPLSRKHLNSRVARIVRMYRWAVEEELVPERVWLRLTTVRPLQAGRSPARETAKVCPVPVEHVEATHSHLRPQTAGAVRLQLYTGMRAGEVLPLCAGQIERGGDAWLYRPAQHKGSHQGKGRVVVFGPRARAVLLEFIKIRCPLCGARGRPRRLGSPDGALCGLCAARMDAAGVCGPWPRVEVETHEPLFSPRDEKKERHEDLRAARKSKVPPSQANRKKANASRQPGRRYSVTNYDNAIRKACEKAAVPRWHSHQLRHTFGTLARRAGGIEAAQTALGHAKADTTEIYAEKNVELAAAIARLIG
jgi:integrase